MDHQSNEIVSSSRNSPDPDELKYEINSPAPEEDRSYISESPAPEDDRSYISESLGPEEGDYHDAEDRDRSSPWEDESPPASPLIPGAESCTLCGRRSRDCSCYEPYYPNGQRGGIYDERLYVKVSVGDHVFTGLIDPGNMASYVNRYMAGICQLNGWERRYENNGSSCVMGEAIVDRTKIFHRYWVLDHLDFSVTLGMDILNRLELKIFMNNRQLEPYYSDAPAEPDEMSVENETYSEVEEEQEEERHDDEVQEAPVESPPEQEEDRHGDEVQEAPVEPPPEHPVVEAPKLDQMIDIVGLPKGIRIIIKLTGQKKIKRLKQIIRRRYEEV